MADWWNAMSSNLAANLITIVVAYYAGRTLLDRRVTNSVVLHIVPMEGVPSSDWEMVGDFTLYNGGPEPIFDLQGWSVWAPERAERIRSQFASNDPREADSGVVPLLTSGDSRRGFIYAKVTPATQKSRYQLHLQYQTARGKRRVIKKTVQLT